MHFYNSGRPRNAAHERVRPLSRNSLSCIYWSSVMPLTMPDPSDPGVITFVSLIYRYAGFGLFQCALCITVNREALARARVSAPPDWKERRENSCVFPAARAYFSSIADILAAEMGRKPLIALPSCSHEISENKYPPVMLRPATLPISVCCVAARTGIRNVLLYESTTPSFFHNTIPSLDTLFRESCASLRLHSPGSSSIWSGL